jgi:nicotinamide mononucleotide (NMN) deamidase PncC/nicotinic acid mononucleotide adenylyltransferase
MDSTVKQLFESLKEEDLSIYIVETGAGHALANKFYDISGASAVIKGSECPYDWEMNTHRFNLNYSDRAVSKETVINTLYHMYRNRKMFGYTDISVSSSVQIGDYSDSLNLQLNNTNTHGWIGVRFQSRYTLYHFTVYSSKTREEYRNDVAHATLCAIQHAVFNEYLVNSHIDAVEEIGSNDAELLILDTCKFIHACDNSTDAVFTIFNKNIENNGKQEDNCYEFVRPVEAFRNHNPIILKGSFNPPQIAHKNMLDASVLTESPMNYMDDSVRRDTKPYFAISLNTYGKGEINTDSLLLRINALMKIGYAIMIFNEPLYYENYDLLNAASAFNNKDTTFKVIFPMGIDTYKRMASDPKTANSKKLLQRMPHAEFHVFNRAGDDKTYNALKNTVNLTKLKSTHTELSSTEIRRMMAFLRANLPEEVYDYVVLNY